MHSTGSLVIVQLNMTCYFIVLMTDFLLSCLMVLTHQVECSFLSVVNFNSPGSRYPGYQ